MYNVNTTIKICQIHLNPDTCMLPEKDLSNISNDKCF